MTETLNRLQHNLDTNTPCEAADIQAVVDFIADSGINSVKRILEEHSAFSDVLEYKLLRHFAALRKDIIEANKRKWVSEKEELPETNKVVLTWNWKGVNMSFINEYGEWDTLYCYRESVENYFQDKEKIDNITHWQPLPSPPENE